MDHDPTPAAPPPPADRAAPRCQSSRRHGRVDRRFGDAAKAVRHERALLRALGDRAAPAQRSLVQLAAALMITGERLAMRVAAGEVVNPEALTGVASELRRVLRTLGLDAAPEAEPAPPPPPPPPPPGFDFAAARALLDSLPDDDE